MILGKQTIDTIKDRVDTFLWNFENGKQRQRHKWTVNYRNKTSSRGVFVSGTEDVEEQQKRIVSLPVFI